MYTRDDEKGWEQSNAFKKTFSIDVDIEFVGVWYVHNIKPSYPIILCIYFLFPRRFRDTVGSVGIIPRRLPFTKSNSHIKFFRHAISLDERRARFKVNLWNRPTEEDHQKGVQKGTMPRHKNPPKKANGDTVRSAKSHKSLVELERQFTDYERPTDIEEVWFAGVHCGT